jgi:hypothetical protein
MPPTSPMDEEFAQKEKEVTDAVIQVIAMAKKENQEILNEETKAVVVEACKQAVASTMAFQNTMKGPFISPHFRIWRRPHQLAAAVDPRHEPNEQ